MARTGKRRVVNKSKKVKRSRKIKRVNCKSRKNIKKGGTCIDDYNKKLEHGLGDPSWGLSDCIESKTKEILAKKLEQQTADYEAASKLAYVEKIKAS